PHDGTLRAHLDEHDVPAHRRVVHAGCDPDEMLRASLLRMDTRTPEELPHLLVTDAHPARSSGRDPASSLTSKLPDLPLQLPHPCLPRVRGDHELRGARGDGELVRIQPRLLALARNQRALGNLLLLLLRVSAEL